MVEDAYAALGVGPEASRSELRAAYRAAVRCWHPDRDPSQEAARRFLAAQRAWELLGDPVRRADYDRRAGRSEVVFVSSASMPARARRVLRRTGRWVATQVAQRHRTGGRDLD